MAVRMWCSGFWHCVDSKVHASVLEKHTVPVFRTELVMLGSGGFCIGLE
jgi:hypothetical protein